ncbi:MAG: SRPBCC domain-containing protein [Ilumatobacteraceae bacterium]|nr:SRPBCC domain-containing protein [Ilumatobacteraceae bacterium]
MPGAPAASSTAEILLDGEIAEVWQLVASAEGWQQWLVDAAEVEVAEGEVAEGAAGEVTDDGVTREVRVTEVDEQRRVMFQWWERDDSSAASEVVIELHPLLGGGSREHIVERPLGMTLSACGARSWDVRGLLLNLTQCTLARV